MILIVLLKIALIGILLHLTWSYDNLETGLGTVLKAGRSVEKLSSNPLGERSLASYAAADGAWFIRTAGHVRRVGAPTK